MEKEELDHIQELYDRGLYVQAYACAERFGPLRQWTGVEGRLIAGRLAANLGAPQLGRWLHLQAYRADRSDPTARYYYARGVLDRRGPLAAWRVIVRFGEPDPARACARTRGEWLSFCGLVAGILRDWDTAECCFERALALAPEHPWIHVERASLLEMQDRYEDALAAARQAIILHPHPYCRSGVQAAAKYLELLGRDDEAMALLGEAAAQLESVVLVAQLAVMQVDRDLWDEAERTLSRYDALAPLAEPEFARWLAGVRSDIAYHRGDLAAAVRLARESGSGFYECIADNMEAAAPDAPAATLPVGFVRQHHKTCAPATLSALSRYWEMPADHLELAEQICYDGTPDYSERHWAETHGYIAREFRVTWESAVALIDRGVPFTLTTVQPGNAHLQATIGYDARRRTLLIRDPYYRHIGEALADEFLDWYRSSGPRGMAMVPAECADLLEGIDLPEAELYDGLYRVQRALLEHRRDDAAAEYAALCAAAPEHRLTLNARRALAAYDADTREMLAATEALIALYPDDANLQMTRLSCLRDLSQREERLRILEELCKPRPEGDEDGDGARMLARTRIPEADHLFWGRYAYELSVDAREHGRAVGLLRRALRRMPTDSRNLATLGKILADQRRFAEAFPLFRFATCLDDKDEGLAAMYFQAARVLGRGNEAMQLLRGRFERFGALSSQPARTLFWALRERGDMAAALAVLDEALRRRPDDGDLLLFCATEFAAYGRQEEAGRLLERGRSKVSRGDWLGAAAGMAMCRGDLAEALSLWRAVVDAEPLAVEAHRAIATLLAQTEGTPAVDAHFRAVSERFPHHYGLHQLWAECLRDADDPNAALAVLDRLVEINPADAWTRRERAIVLGSRCHRFEAAFAEAEEARRLDPTDTSLFAAYGDLYAAAGRWQEAKRAYCEAIRLSVDNDYAIGQLVSICDEGQEQRKALQFIQGELKRQTIFGDGLLAFRRFARGVLGPGELRVALLEARAARSDLWHAWSALMRHLLEEDRRDEARGWARQATAAFPLNAALWLDLADAEGACGDREAERAALEQALAVRPGWGPALRRKCSLLERAGDTAAALALLESAVQRDPGDPAVRFALAQALWNADRREEAIAQVRTVAEREPGFSPAWEALQRWCEEAGRRDEPATVARAYAERRPGEASAWLVLASALSGPEHLDERLAALRRCTELDPRCFEAYDTMATLLGEAGRWEEAFAACRPPESVAGVVPVALKGRAAWLEDLRGDRAAAIEGMRAAVREDRDYRWGWAQLAEWYNAAGDAAGYADATANLVRIDPREVVNWGMHADALQKRGDWAGMRNALWRAFDLDRRYLYAARALFELCLEGNALEEAQAVMNEVVVDGDDPLPAMFGVRLAIARKDRTPAREHLMRMCTWPGKPSTEFLGSLQYLEEKLASAGWEDLAYEAYRDALSRDDVRPEVGETWVIAAARRGEWECEKRFADLRKRGAVGDWAMGAYAEALARAGRKRELSRYIAERRTDLRRADYAWAGVATALAMVDDYREADAWTGDWRSRLDLQPWMLFPRVMALRHITGGRNAEAAEIGRHALSLPADGTTPRHAVWLLLDAALDGNPDDRRLLALASDAGEQGPYWNFLWEMALAVREVNRATGDPTAAFAAARRRLAVARKQFPAYRQAAPLPRLHRAAVRRIGQRAGSFGGKVWGVVASAMG